MFAGKKILITGGTGSLGRALTKKLLKEDVDTIRIYSRDELKQSQMQSEIQDDRLRFFIGDVRDKDRLSRAVEEVDIVIHTAALKQIATAEYNPFEAVKTNVYGSQNLIDCCLDNNVDIALAIGTDKAVSPLNTYGASKMLMERLFVSANYYKGKRKTKFLCVRYGNVLGSRGSLLPVMLSQIKNNEEITITDPSMTRFNISMNEALELILRTLKYGKGGEVFVPKLKAYRVKEMKEAIMELTNANNNEKRIPVRPGEKFHETLISKEELRNTFESDKDYIIFEKQNQNYDYNSIKEVKSTILTENYSSDLVPELTKNEIKAILKKENLI
ncbi:polysaccharide biosynthesis protein CapD [Candidatus Nitrosopumilus koreensis AR1]|uniref:Polysaccharide biosynthesis protein CapD n=1 Tax=Candidatus Nitrosopumilus koreensis AR1 TaxID=1229908 RepID=K0B4G1_9ARCH|nr:MULTISPECIES: SDR family NAD(P)-dependent oxidoreductase [Nitrosopumilus]AFS80017.1 polysaccharide biosynthesis protein CapD [Candidatus Nitrosopumilus koreensis AR1]